MFAFGAPALDPILVTTQFATSVVDYFILGQETIWNAIRLSLKQEIMKHTSIYVATQGSLYKITDAAWRRRPNGEEVRCCQQVSKYMGTDKRGDIKFRCQVTTHSGQRTFRISPLPETPGDRCIWGKKGGARYMVSRCRQLEL